MTIPSFVCAESSPSTINPAQLEKRFENPVEPLSRPKQITIPSVKSGSMPANAADISFRLVEVNLRGNTVFEATQLEAIYQQQLGSQITLADLYAIAERLTAYYANKGYLLSRAFVPQQTIESGRVSISVIEGYVDEVLIEGVDGLPDQMFSHYREMITASRPLHASVLERFLLLANDLPGLSFKSVLNPSESNPGAATLLMKATRAPWQAAVSLDNRGSQSSGPWQLLLEGTANNLFDRFDKTTLRFATVPNDLDELKYWQLTHSQVVNSEGLVVGIDLTDTESTPDGPTYRLLDVETAGDSQKVFLSYPMIRSREENLTLAAEFSLRQSDTLQLGLLNTRDELRVLRLSASYDKADAFAGGGINVFSTTFNQGLDVASAQVQSRLNAEVDFTHLGLSLRRIQQLPVLGKAWSLDLRMQGQYTDETLPSPEQFGLGGENTVRGYEPAEWTGDRALTGSLELRYQLPVSWDGDAHVYSFYDYGKIWRENALFLRDTQTAESAGIGTRLKLPADMSLNLELAKPFDRHFDGDDADWEMFGRFIWQY